MLGFGISRAGIDGVGQGGVCQILLQIFQEYPADSVGHGGGSGQIGQVPSTGHMGG